MKLLALLGENKSTFNIPVYQRNYEWNKEQLVQYFKDLEKIVKEGYNNYHFMGTIVFVSNEKQGLMMERIIIDGQQRITTTMLLLKAIHDTLDENDAEQNARKEEIYETYIINKYVDEKYKLKLKPVKEDMSAYVDLIESNETSTDSKVITNYKLLVELINNSRYSVKELYDALAYIEIVYISLEKNSKAENPQLIFESLNSTGLSLTESDLIRNFVLMGLDYEEQTRCYNLYWVNLEKKLTNSRISEFVRDYLTMKTGYVSNKNKVYTTFKKYYIDNNYSSEEILIDLVRYAKYYHWFININNDDKDINEKLWQIDFLKSTVVYPYLLDLFDDYYEKGSISREELINTLTIIISYLFRRAICNIPTNVLNKIFASMTKNVRKLKEMGMAHVDAIIDYLMSKDGSSIFPRDEQFKRSFTETDIYNRGNKLALFTLYSIEKFSHKEVVDYNELTIEHIMPQTLTPKWKIDLGKDSDETFKIYKDTIGNLTLTKYNPELSNSSFDDKKVIYNDSNIKITRGVSSYDKWDRDTIVNRANDLFNIAQNIWELPVDKYIDLDETNLVPGVEYSINDDIDVTGYKPTALLIDNDKKQVSSWREMLIVTCRFLIDIDKELFHSLVTHNNFKRILSNESNGLRNPCQLSHNLYLETNLNAKDIINYIKLFTMEYDMHEFFEFTIRY